MAGVAFEPVPLDLVPGSQFIELAPEILVSDRFFAKGSFDQARAMALATKNWNIAEPIPKTKIVMVAVTSLPPLLWQRLSNGNGCISKFPRKDPQ
jgi:hypothetical protein